MALDRYRSRESLADDPALSSLDDPPIFQGYMDKKGERGFNPQMKRRYFVGFKGGILRYYEEKGVVCQAIAPCVNECVPCSDLNSCTFACTLVGRHSLFAVNATIRLAG